MVIHKTLIKILTVVLIAALSNKAYSADNSEKLFVQTNQLYETLLKDSVKSNQKEIWEKLADAFYGIFKSYPNGSKAPISLFLSGKLYEQMGYKFDSDYYLKQSVQKSKDLIDHYPNSKYADDAQIRIARITERWDKGQAFIEYEKILNDYPGGDMVYAATGKVKELASYKPKSHSFLSRILNDDNNAAEPENTVGLARVINIRNFSLDDYTRVVIDMDQEKEYHPHLLKADPELGTPPRLFVDIDGTYVDPNLRIPSLTSGLLKDIKFGRYTSNKTRVVLYMKSLSRYNVFYLKNPFRIVMDIYGDSSPKTMMAKDEVVEPDSIITGSRQPRGEMNLSKALGLKISRIVIDPGHGGHDPGAIGPSGLKEKDVNLRIAKALKEKLEEEGKKYGITDVSLTRNTDKFIKLEDRTTIARQRKADLFISIHCNAARSRDAHGIETYILSLTNDKKALELAARENAYSTQDVSDMEKLLKNIIRNSKIGGSKELASLVQNSIVTSLNKKYGNISNKGIKKAPFVVLIGADVPSILVESSFITNPRDEKRLKDKNFIDHLAQGIYAGVIEYSNGTKTAYLQ